MSRRARRLLVLVVGTLMLGGWVIAGQGGAGAATQSWTLSPEDEEHYVANINAIRSSNGLGPLELDTNMRAAARDWTAWMAENATLAHADDIVTGAPADWLKVGENVGRGGTLTAVWDAFLASPSHAANVLDPDFDLVGVGVVWTDDGRLYTTHRFASTASAEAQPPAPTAEPAAAESASPSVLPFADPGPSAAPAPERLAITMELLLAAG